VLTVADIVFVHGAWHGPWCWDQVAGALVKRGHHTESVYLPGHDQPGSLARIRTPMADYIRAVAETLSGAREPVVLVGHSMGGYVVQRYLETGRAAAAILIASVPNRGNGRANLRAFRRRPKTAMLAALTSDYSHFIRTDELVREQFFTAKTPELIVSECRRQLQNESTRAIAAMALRRPKPRRNSTPVAVIAAAADGIYLLADQQRLAAAYGVEPLVLDGGHDLMLDTTWPALVDAIDTISRQHTAHAKPADGTS
jgi:pimeloyl-ACP methyl ester carboxylesterase